MNNVEIVKRRKKIILESSLQKTNNNRSKNFFKNSIDLAVVEFKILFMIVFAFNFDIWNDLKLNSYF